MIERHSWTATVLAHLLPGLLALGVYVPATRLAAWLGLPPPFALFVTMLVVLIPYELAVLLHARKSGARSAPPQELIPYRRRLSASEYALLVPPLVAWAFFCFFVLAPHEERLVSSQLSPWLPAWLLGANVSSAYPKGAWVATMLFGIAVNGLAVPIIEELYFRGYLLPRIPLSSRWAPLLNAALFSLYHLFSPWQNLTRTAAVIPIAYAVSWKRSIHVGIAAHCLLNTIAMALALLMLLR
jgi:membrane protease YdiL (CAAX protease family)